MNDPCKEINALDAIKNYPIQSLLFLFGWVGFFVLSAIKQNPFNTGYSGLFFFVIAFLTTYFFIANGTLNKNRK